MNEEKKKAAEAEELIQEIRKGKAEVYPEVRKQLLKTELSEADFSSELFFRWYETIQKAAPEEFFARAGVRMTVSMTSWPGRISAAAEALKGIYNQSRKADRVLLWLAEEQFPGKEADLPEALKEQANEGRVIIRWCEDLKPHKKYFFALQEETEGVTVTVDDDLVYAPDMLEILWLSYLCHPEAVSAMRTHYMAVSEEGTILPYDRWIKTTDARIGQPDMLLFATTGAGTLYPAGIIGKEWFDSQVIRETCLMADDLWMKTAEAIQGIPVVQACRNRGLKYVSGSQEESLWETNREKNDVQLRKILDWTAEKYGPDTLGRKLTAGESGLEEYSFYACSEIEKIKAKLRQVSGEKSELKRQYHETEKKAGEKQAEAEMLRNSLSYRLGHALLAPGREIRKIIGRKA